MTKLPKDLKNVPPNTQKNEYTCGTAVVQAVAQYFGYWTHQDDVAKQLPTTRKKGTDTPDIVKYFKAHKLKAEIKDGLEIKDLESLLDKPGVAIVLLFQAWGEKKDYSQEWDDGHFAILVGIKGDTLYFRDPSLMGSIGFLTKTEFTKRWHDFEIHDGKRKEYLHTAIVVQGHENSPAPLVPIE
jgi:predicted double-glycine peptidase